MGRQQAGDSEELMGSSSLKARRLGTQQESSYYERKAWKRLCPSSRQIGGVHLILVRVSLFIPFRLSAGCMRPTHTGEGLLPYLVHQFKCESHPETVSQTYSEECLTSDRASCGSVRLTHKIMHLCIGEQS